MRDVRIEAPSMIRRTRVEVDLSAIVDNARIIAARTGGPVFAVVKADGYGHGAVAVAQALAASHAAAGFAVSLVEEAVALRDAGVAAPVLVMGPSQMGGEEAIIGLGLTPVVADREEIAALGRARGTQPVQVHLKVDTGMGRLGVAMSEAVAIAQFAQQQGVHIVGLMSHFANADSDDPADPDAMTYTQLRAFAHVRTALLAAGAPIRVCHSANSAAAMMFPQARMDFVRCGLALYGNGHWPSDTAAAEAVAQTPTRASLPGADKTAERTAPAGPLVRRQAMRLVTEVAQVRTVEAGATVGYGALWRATRPTRVAVLPLGYADGLPKRATGAFVAAIGGRPCPLLGAISMDIAIADITDFPELGVGAQAVLLGGTSASEFAISTMQYSKWTGLTEYEVTCGMSKRVPRTYVGVPT